MQTVVRGFLVFDITGSASSLAVIAVSSAIPLLILAPVGGLAADRVNKRHLIIVTQIGAATASGVVAVLVIGGWVTFTHLIVMTVVMSVLFAFNVPARQAMAPALVPRHKLGNAIAIQMGGTNLARIAAPATGGVLIAALGAGWVYGLMFLLFVAASTAELRLPVHGMVSDHSPVRIREDFVAGMAHTMRDRTMRMLMVGALAVPLFGYPLQQMLPVFADDVFGWNATGLGALAGAAGAGGVIGALISTRIGNRTEKGALMLAGGLVMALAMVAFSLSPWILLALPLLATATMGQMVFSATNNTAVQMTVPPELRGRVMGLLQMSYGLTPLGVVPVAAAADAFGAPAAMAGAGCLLLLTWGVLFAVSRRLRRLRIELPDTITLSPVRAATLVAEGKISQEEADHLLGLRPNQPTDTTGGPP